MINNSTNKTNGHKTAINIEIDQTASGVVFLAYMLKNKKLAEAANIINCTSIPKCPYTHCMNKFEEFYKLKFKHKNVAVLVFCSTNRNLHKYALMCYSYAQTKVGRTYAFIDLWYDVHGVEPSKEEMEVLQEFASVYTDFIDYMFKDMNKQLEVLKRIVKFVANETSKISIRTLEGEVIEWRFYKYTSKKRKVYDPLTLVPKNYSINILEKEKTKSGSYSMKTDLSTHTRKFLSFFIHSIDAAIMRHFISQMYEKHDYRVNHLHDCVILHPNYVDNFYSIVEETYSSGKLNSLTEDLMFVPFRNSISSDSMPELEALIKESYSYSDEYLEQENTFNPRHLYKFES